jgi:methylated-DNA-[protein]-cysteine S-methyltransferase
VAADLMVGLSAVSMDTPLGGLVVVLSDLGVVETAFADPSEDLTEALARIEHRRGGALAGAGRRGGAVRREIEGYLAHRRTAFETPPDLSFIRRGFSRRVLEVTATIPYGEIWTYGDVAEMAGSPRGGRAAGNALGSCPIELYVPCHRVVHTSGAIRGYGRHEDRKRWLLRHEGLPV